jgi:YHS domain-containing protein
MLTIISLAGCKKKSEPAAPKGATSVAGEQTLCPVMGGAINKNIFTEYKGKKVYFCCAPCADKFKANPQEYIAKLPQFKD